MVSAKFEERRFFRLFLLFVDFEDLSIWYFMVWSLAELFESVDYIVIHPFSYTTIWRGLYIYALHSHLYGSLFVLVYYRFWLPIIRSFHQFVVSV